MASRVLVKKSELLKVIDGLTSDWGGDDSVAVRDFDAATRKLLAVIVTNTPVKTLRKYAEGVGYTAALEDIKDQGWGFE